MVEEDPHRRLLMPRVRLLLAGMMACAVACGDAMQFPSFPSPPSVVLASVAAHTDGPATGITCFPDTNETMDGPHMAVAVTLMEPPDTTTACGNIEFNGQLRTIEVAYSLGKAEPPYVYWWSGARRGATWLYVLDTLEVDTLAPEVNATFTDPLWLDDDYDGIGVVGVNSNDPALVVTDSVFTVAFSGGDDQFARNYMLQHWAEKLPPASVGTQVSGFVVTLSWTNRHGNRDIDSTVVFRDGVMRRTLDHSAQSFVDTVPGYDTYVYRLKHVAGPLINEINGTLVSPNSPSSESILVTVNQPPQASFSVACQQLPCTFTDGSSDADGTIVSWDWTFGDGGSSSAQHPTHTYPAGGDYQARLIVTDDGGARDTVLDWARPLQVAIMGPTSVRPQDVCQWNDASAGGWPGLSYAWTVRGQAAGTDPWVIASTGTAPFPVRLVATDARGQVDTATVEVALSSKAPACWLNRLEGATP
jgi:hypothetical protein